MIEGLTNKNVGSLELCIRDTGSGPTVVLLHGTSANLGVWDGVVEQLGNGVRTVAVDQRGHGRSDKPEDGYSAAEFSEDIARLIRSLDCGPALVVGHSLGARNAMVLASNHPELVSGVVAVDYSPFVEKEVLDDLQVRVAAGDQVFQDLDEVRNYLRNRYTLIQDKAVERRAVYGYELNEEAGGLQPLAPPKALEHTVNGLRIDFVEEASAITVPVTIIRGELSRIVSEDAIRKTQELRPDFKIVELADIDHYVPEERPDIVADEIRLLLEQDTNILAQDSTEAFN